MFKVKGLNYDDSQEFKKIVMESKSYNEAYKKMEDAGFLSNFINSIYPRYGYKSNKDEMFLAYQMEIDNDYGFEY